MSKKILSLILTISISLSLFSVNSCKKDTKTQPNQTTNPGDKGTGLVVNDKRYENIPFSSPAFSGTLPSSYDLTSSMPPIGDQGQQGSCVAWAVGYCLKSYQEKIENGYSYTDDSKMMSPSYIYNQIKVNPNVCNSGSNFDDAFMLLKSQGVCSKQAMPYNENDCSTQPNSSQKSSAIQNEIDYYKSVHIDNLSDIKAFVSQGFPVVIGANIDADFQKGQSDNTGKFIWKNNSSADKGYHALVVIGYDDAINAFKVQNSWGKAWANDGYGWIDYQKFTTSVHYAFVAYDKKNTPNNTASLQITGNCPSSVEVGTTSQFTMTITNNGDKDVKIEDIKLNSTTSGIFSIPTMPTLPKTLNPTESINVLVNFKPLTTDNYNATFEVFSKDITSGSTYISLGGQGQITPCNNQIKVTIKRFLLSRQIYVYLYLVSGSSKIQINDPLVLLEHDSGSFYNLANGIYKIECLDSYDQSLIKTFNFKVSNCTPDNTAFDFYD